MSTRILLLDEPHPKARAIMEEVAECYTVEELQEEVSASLRHKQRLFLNTSNRQNIADNIIGIYTQLTPITKEIMDNCGAETVFCPCTDVSHIQAPKIIHLDELWKSTEGQQITSTAEHTFSLILQLAKMRRMQLKGKVLGIIGCGRIGDMVTEYAGAFNMGVEQYDKSFTLPWATIERVLRNSDIITLHVPLNDETRGMISTKEFALMKDGALLINTSRQSIVDIAALKKHLIIESYDDTHIYYADDFKDEVDLTEYGAIQTPHIAGNTEESRMLTDIYIANKVKEYINGL